MNPGHHGSKAVACEPVRVPAALASVLVITAAAVATSETPANGSASIENQVLAHINDARSDDLIVHSGLVAIARTHSQNMAANGDLYHGDWTGRILRAPPDPAEANGPPDDGFTTSWCENAAWADDPEGVMSESEVAAKLYETWKRSAPHHRCMVNPDVTVIGIGVYHQTDEGRWWATLDAVEDETPPGGPATAPATAPAPPTEVVETPVPSEIPRGTEPEVATAPVAREPVDDGADVKTVDAAAVAPSPATPSAYERPIALGPVRHSSTTPLGRPELLAALGILAWTLLSYLVFARRAP